MECKICGGTRFYARKEGTAGKPRCAECQKTRMRAYYRTPSYKAQNRIRHITQTRGLSLEDYTKMVSKQKGKCAICKQTPLLRPLKIDHSHETGAVRGLLCNACNAGLGTFKDNPKYLRAAIAYLGSRRPVTSSGR